MQSPLAPNDLFSIVTVTDPQLARDGSVYFRRAQLDRAADATLSTIWRVAAGRVAPFTAGRSDQLPRVAPDGATLAFVGEHDEQSRIYLIPTSGGEARAIGSAYEKIVALAWSPDGTRLAFVASTEHEPATARVFHDAPSGARHIRGRNGRSAPTSMSSTVRPRTFTRSPIAAVRWRVRPGRTTARRSRLPATNTAMMPAAASTPSCCSSTRKGERSFRFRPDWIARSATRSSATCARDSRFPRPFGALRSRDFRASQRRRGVRDPRVRARRTCDPDRRRRRA
jgi:dipeptidyl aminopeptidase/acylaminoacyl peptidase